MECREHPTIPMIYGFIQNKMGIKLRKRIAELHKDEQAHYRNYLRNIRYDEDDNGYIRTTYKLPIHGWGRVNAEKSLSMSLFHRPSRHSFAIEKYLDFDMENAQPQILLELARKVGMCVDGLDEYCANPKKCRQEIAAFYEIKDIVDETGYVYTTYDQSKLLPIRIAFSGGALGWKRNSDAVIKKWICR